MTLSNNSEPLDFVIEVLTSIKELKYDEKRRAYCGLVKDEDSLTFDEVNQKMESLGFDTFGNDEQNRYLEFKITDTGAYRDIEHYIALAKRRLDEKPTTPIYIVDIDYKYEPDVECTNPIFKNVLDVAYLFNSLHSIADHTGNNGVNPFVLFIGKDNLKISSAYETDVLNLSLDNIQVFVKQFILNETHQEDRVLVIKNALQEAYTDKDITLTEFLKKFENFFKIVRNNFQLYMDKFSFEDFKHKIEDEKREYLLKINKIFSDMQNQLLTLPIASVIAASQMSKVASFGDGVKNIALMIGVYIFAYMIRIFAHNQEDSLDAIRSEIGIKKKEIQLKEHSDYQKDYLEICKIGLDRVDTISDKITSVLKLTSFVVLMVTAIFILRFFI
ncbi:hypothetical protein [Acinetobacter baumannii]|uniref:hypothetical protein n=1 Tax=Acinetobacter baumannii TaxID=470 RepID=UPI0022EA649F|nr:hypothetical protein [Acinetobacter baumannii]MDA3431698.1 hypothetical protein [Acinetobacter baumannii]